MAPEVRRTFRTDVGLTLLRTEGSIDNILEAEKGRAGRARLAEVEYGSDMLLSLQVPIPPRAEIEVRLSSAETHVAWLVCDGLSNREIAIERGTAERTVANQVASIFSKLEVSRRFDVAQFLLGLR